MSRPSFVVTGGARGVGLAITQRLCQDGHVVVLDLATEMSWVDPAVQFITGDAGEKRLAAEAAERAESVGPLSGWVNNAAIFRDAALDTGSAQDVLDLITANLALTVTGCHTAVNHYLRHPAPAPSSTSPPTRRSVPCEERCPTQPPRPRLRALPARWQ